MARFVQGQMTACAEVMLAIEPRLIFSWSVLSNNVWNETKTHYDKDDDNSSNNNSNNDRSIENDDGDNDGDDDNDADNYNGDNVNNAIRERD